MESKYNKEYIENLFKEKSINEILDIYSKSTLIEMYKVVYDGLKPVSNFNKSDIAKDIKNFYKTEYRAKSIFGDKSYKGGI